MAMQQGQCSACGNIVFPNQKIPVWAIVLAVVFFPLGLLFLLAKTTVCPACGRAFVPRPYYPPQQGYPQQGYPQQQGYPPQGYQPPPGQQPPPGHGPPPA